MYLFGYSDTPQAREDYQARQREIQALREQRYNAGKIIDRNLILVSLAALSTLAGLEISSQNPAYLNSILNLGQEGLLGLTFLKTLPSIFKFSRTSEKLNKLGSPLEGVLVE
jgi:hypothetical protein